MAEKVEKMISLKVLVDKKHNRVIFAEADNDFVDVLFSFLTLPIGTIARLIGKHDPSSAIGCMNNLYRSVENLDTRHFHTQTCKTMLLRTRNSSANECRKLKINVDDTEPTEYYLCNSWSSKEHASSSLSTFANSQCSCGGSMKQASHTNANLINKDVVDGVFVKGATIFMITEDLQIMRMSTGSTLASLSNLGIRDLNAVEKMTIDIGLEEVLSLLKHSMIGKTPLTDVLLLKQKDPSVPIYMEKFEFYSQKDKNVSKWKKIDLKVTVKKSENKVLYAEAGNDFVSFLFSILTFPLGTLVKLLDKTPSLGCMTNLYKSVENLSNHEYIKSVNHKDMLLSPKFALQYGFKDHNLDISEVTPPKYYSNNKKTSNYSSSYVTITTNEPDPDIGWFTDEFSKLVTLVNHKLSSATGSNNIQGYVKGPATIMVTDDLVMTLFSSMSCISIFEELQIPIDDIEERLVSIGEDEALQMLEASLISKSALKNAFYLNVLKKPKQETS